MGINVVADGSCSVNESEKKSLETRMEERGKIALDLGIGQKIDAITISFGHYYEVFPAPLKDSSVFEKGWTYERGMHLIISGCAFRSFRIEGDDNTRIRTVSLEKERESHFLGIFKRNESYFEEVYEEHAYFSDDEVKKKVIVFKEEGKWLDYLNKLYAKTTDAQRLKAGIINDREMTLKQRKELGGKVSNLELTSEQYLKKEIPSFS